MIHKFFGIEESGVQNDMPRTYSMRLFQIKDRGDK